MALVRSTAVVGDRGAVAADTVGFVAVGTAVVVVDIAVVGTAVAAVDIAVEWSIPVQLPMVRLRVREQQQRHLVAVVVHIAHSTAPSRFESGAPGAQPSLSSVPIPVPVRGGNPT